MTITPIYAAILAFVFIYLTLRTIKLRRQFKVAIGHGNQTALERAIRAHANFAEYTPFALLLLAMLENTARLDLLSHGLGLALTTGRIIHAYNISQETEVITIRVIGMTLTLAVIITAAVGIITALLLQKLG